MTNPQTVTDVIARLREMSDDAYCSYSRQLNRSECLGWKAKVETQTFGETELSAHCNAAEMLGRHRALHEAAMLLKRGGQELTGRNKR